MSFLKSQGLLLFTSLLIFICSVPLQARTFKNAYISFEMLDTWRCKLEQTEFVCRSEDPQEAKEAVIILTAKEKGPTDSFPIYTDHLIKPITAPSKSGGTITSTVTIAPREVMINDQKWIDSLHINSEVQNYYTRYLATIKDQIAILVTFTAHNSKYQKHSGHFADTVKSLRVIATRDLTAGTSGAGIRGAGESLGGAIGQAMPPDLLASEDGAEAHDGKGKGLFSNPKILGLFIFVLALMAYIGIRIYQSKKKSS